MTPEQELEATDLHDLLNSSGWKRFREMLLREIAGDFEEHITKALDHNDATLAIDRMRQVASVRKAGLRWLRLPNERLAMIEAQADAAPLAFPVGRRPVGV